MPGHEMLGVNLSTMLGPYEVQTTSQVLQGLRLNSHPPPTTTTTSSDGIETHLKIVFLVLRSKEAFSSDQNRTCSKRPSSTWRNSNHAWNLPQTTGSYQGHPVSGYPLMSIDNSRWDDQKIFCRKKIGFFTLFFFIVLKSENAFETLK